MLNSFGHRRVQHGALGADSRYIYSMRRLLAVALLTLAGTAAADESIPPKEVLAVMTRRRIEIRKVCWEQSPEKADASVKIDFVIAKTGVVTDATARDPVGPASIIKCVAAEVKKTTFPASEKGGWFRWPFVFKGP
jgi:hypothetical protein